MAGVGIVGALGQLDGEVLGIAPLDHADEAVDQILQRVLGIEELPLGSIVLDRLDRGRRVVAPVVDDDVVEHVPALFVGEVGQLDALGDGQIHTAGRDQLRNQRSLGVHGRAPVVHPEARLRPRT